MWDAARATTVVDFKKEMKRIKDIEAAAHTYLLAFQPNWWTRSAFSTFCKYDALLNNICESFNGYILEARDKPIIKMLEMKPPSRPKKLRRREPDEPRDSYRVSKKHVQIRCGKCHRYRHNRKTCKGQVAPKKGKAPAKNKGQAVGGGKKREKEVH
ncbi:hypothetical protein L1049_011410 [Liquidambar formosana]|uniref:Uncharacterized protein n=1 Tax=Liquidambar formosana TaxID=63359 RepID=A0AAP0RRI0_LIQFO